MVLYNAVHLAMRCVDGSIRPVNLMGNLRLIQKIGHGHGKCKRIEVSLLFIMDSPHISFIIDVIPL